LKDGIALEELETFLSFEPLLVERLNSAIAIWSSAVWIILPLTRIPGEERDRRFGVSVDRHCRVKLQDAFTLIGGLGEEYATYRRCTEIFNHTRQCSVVDSSVVA
jgi:hypothetical protein